MNRQNTCVVAILALALVAWGQEPNEGRVEVKVVGPVGGVHAIEPAEIEIQDIDLGDAVGSVILGVEGQPQDADEKGGGKAKLRRKIQDADQDGTIVKEIDLGDGKTMRIVITTKKGDGKSARTWLGTMPEGFGVMKGGEGHVFHQPDAKVRGTIVAPGGPEGMKGLKLFGAEGMHDLAPHAFRFEALGGEMKDHMDRALRAFDRAREEFIRAYEEGDKGPKDKRPAPDKMERRMRLAKPASPHVIIGKAEGEKDDDDAAEKAEAREKTAKAEVDAHAQAVEKIKSRMEEELKEAQGEATKARAAKRGAVQWVDVAPGASTKGEIESLRKEIKELEKMVRDLKDQLEKK